MTRVRSDNSARYFFTTTIWARKSTRRADVQRVTGEDDDIEFVRGGEQPIKLRQRIMQIGNDKAAHAQQLGDECEKVAMNVRRIKTSYRRAKSMPMQHQRGYRACRC